MRKGDRLPLISSTTSEQIEIVVPRAIVAAPELLEGCEPVISSIVNSPLTRVAGSCLS